MQGIGTSELHATWLLKAELNLRLFSVQQLQTGWNVVLEIDLENMRNADRQARYVAILHLHQEFCKVKQVVHAMI